MWSVPHPHAHLGHTLMFCHLKSFYITSPWQTASSLPISKVHLRETHPPVAPPSTLPPFSAESCTSNHNARGIVQLPSR